MRTQAARELQTQETQTEGGLQRTVEVRQPLKETTALLNGKTMTVQIKKHSFQLTLK